MKRRARERLPKREPGAFPSYLYKSLNELEGAWGDAGADASGLIRAAHQLHRKPMLLLSDEEIGLALRQRIGLPWLRTLVLLRLRQDPLRLAEVHDAGDMLRYALRLRREEWDDLAPELEAIADTIVPLLPETPDHLPLMTEYRRFKSTESTSCTPTL